MCTGISTLCSTCWCVMRVLESQSLAHVPTSSSCIGTGISTSCSTCWCLTRVCVIVLGTCTTSSCCMGTGTSTCCSHMLMLYPGLSDDLRDMNHFFLQVWLIELPRFSPSTKHGFHLPSPFSSVSCVMCTGTSTVCSTNCCCVRICFTILGTCTTSLSKDIKSSFQVHRFENLYTTPTFSALQIPSIFVNSASGWCFITSHYGLKKDQVPSSLIETGTSTSCTTWQQNFELPPWNEFIVGEINPSKTQQLPGKSPSLHGGSPKKSQPAGASHALE